MKKLFTLLIAGVLSVSLFACGSTSVSSVDINVEDVWTEFEAQVPSDERAPVQSLDDTMLEQIYGLTDAEVTEYVANAPLLMTQADEFFIAEVVDGQMETVKEKILTRQEALAQSWSTYLPDQYEAVQNYTLVENGNYILFSIGAHSETLVEIFNAEFE